MAHRCRRFPGEAADGKDSTLPGTLVGLRAILLRHGGSLLAPFQTAKYETTLWPRWLVQKRRRIETVFAQLVERYRSKRAWARDHWHLCSRWLPKVLSHTTAVLLYQRHGLGALEFRHLVSA